MHCMCHLTIRRAHRDVSEGRCGSFVYKGGTTGSENPADVKTVLVAVCFYAYVTLHKRIDYIVRKV